MQIYCLTTCLEQINLTTKDNILPRNIEGEVLQSVIFMLINTNETYEFATRRYLEPLDGHQSVYRFIQGGQQTELVTYYIGKYGAWPTAVRVLLLGVAVHDNANTVVTMADQCFPNLGAIICVGIACGIKKKVQMLDVLVSSQVFSCDKAMDKHQGYLPKGDAITTSNQLVKLFTQPLQWPNNAFQEHFFENRQQIPSVKSGVIYSGPYLIDEPATIKTLVKNFAHDVIGIDMDGGNLFPDLQIIANAIIVKGVCDFGDGKKVKVHQHNAALLAADLVHKGLSDPQAVEILKGSATYICMHVMYLAIYLVYP